MNNFLPPPLFADVIQLIIFIVVVVFSILGSIFNKEKPAARQVRKKRPPQKPQPNNEIESFIRQITEPGNQAKQEQALDLDPGPEQPVVRRKKRRPRPQPIAGQAGIRAGEDIQQHVQSHLSSNLTDSKLANGIEHRDEAMQSHIEEVFEHKLGSLQSTTDESTKSKATPEPMAALSASDIASLFQSPIDIRRAVIMNEILTRPDQRSDYEM